ncbi:MAG TPA: phosphocholine cytidylyltransferase family protein [Gemmatimonadaceae bacterium]|nr:phosphocholine cytidylyltransferase family protein [Gemmatimonadaceae bacterium]
MQAVILAAGVGSRLRSLSGGKPKCLIEVGGKPLILHQLQALADHGVGPVTCVIGYRADEVREVIGDRADIIVNERYEETNSLYSLWLARERVKEAFVLMNCDLVFDPDILARLLEEEGNVLAYDSTSSQGREQTKVAIKQRKVVDLGKDLPPGSARGESLGLLKFDAKGAVAMMQMADYLIQDGHETAWVIEATRAVCQIVPIYGVNVAGKPWTEIDFPYDLDVARREVWPAIHKGRWRQYARWRQTRWGALAAGLAVFAATGWLANTQLGPASVEWESVPVNGGTMVPVTRRGHDQRWFRIAAHAPSAAIVEGGVARLESRLALAAGNGASDSAHYSVAVTLDGTPLAAWTFGAARDTSANLAGQPLSRRERTALTIPPGRHVLGIELTGSNAGDLILRVRQAEATER